MKKTMNYLTTALATIALTSSLYAAPETDKKAEAEKKPEAEKSAANTAQTKATIAVLDVNRILTDSKAAKGLNEKMEKLRSDYETKIASKEEALRKEEAALTDQTTKIKEADLEKRKKAFEANVAELQKSIMAQQNQMTNAAQEAMNTIRESVFKITKEIAEKEGYHYVQPVAGFVYFQPEVDITTKTIERLDKELPEVKVVLKEVAAPATPVPAANEKKK